jgi:hypothetical protein
LQSENLAKAYGREFAQMTDLKLMTPAHCDNLTPPLDPPSQKSGPPESGFDRSMAGMTDWAATPRVTIHFPRTFELIDLSVPPCI